ncbi:hypothetical protein, partial [uncultured Variovorax sp.]|uniref:hypothetical protein n=1 Tax=uncultured Variovorax sp. TaxID=114708 RepID=UPI00262AF665
MVDSLLSDWWSNNRNHWIGVSVHSENCLRPTSHVVRKRHICFPSSDKPDAHAAQVLHLQRDAVAGLHGHRLGD